MQWYIALGSVLILIIATFAYQNPQEVTLRFLAWEIPSMSLVLLIFFSTAMGALMTLLFSLAKQIRQGIQIAELQNKIKLLEKKLADSNSPQDLNNQQQAPDNKFIGGIKKIIKSKNTAGQ